jgi:N-formylglutamate deformylase
MNVSCYSRPTRSLRTCRDSFDGKLPDLCFGTNHGKTCDPSLEQSLAKLAEQVADYSHVFNGRFVGGYITRAYGDPAHGVHAVQLELSQATYLDEASKSWSDQKVVQVQPVLRSIIAALLEWTDPGSDLT